MGLDASEQAKVDVKAFLVEPAGTKSYFATSYPEVSVDQSILISVSQSHIDEHRSCL